MQRENTQVQTIQRLSTQGQIRPERNTLELNAQREHKEEQSADVTTEKNTQGLNKIGQIIKVNTEKQNARAKHTSTKFQFTKKEHRRTEYARTDHNRTIYANTECTRTGQKIIDHPTGQGNNEQSFSTVYATPHKSVIMNSPVPYHSTSTTLPKAG
ncbi:unnamed protein product [Parnassius apollo]|uniref:(apollo) hypothetical protein n=1 Tax=Parnassius apollo TaxID=110799 RepID=A0A8S3W9F8_PARAO|nr:unnamed protein product [Parnassius apollo]